MAVRADRVSRRRRTGLVSHTRPGASATYYRTRPSKWKWFIHKRYNWARSSGLGVGDGGATTITRHQRTV